MQWNSLTVQQILLLGEEQLENALGEEQLENAIMAQKLNVGGVSFQDSIVS